MRSLHPLLSAVEIDAWLEWLKVASSISLALLHLHPNHTLQTEFGIAILFQHNGEGKSFSRHEKLRRSPLPAMFVAI